MKKLCLTLVLTIICAWSASTVPPASAQTTGYGYNGYTYQLYLGSDSSAAVYAYTPSLAYYTSVVYGPYVGYTPVALTSDYYGNSYLLWKGTYGAVVWYLNPQADYVYGYVTPIYAGWTPVGISSYTYNLGFTWTYVNDAYTWYWHLTNSIYAGVGTISYDTSAYYATPTGYSYSAVPALASRAALSGRRTTLVSAPGHAAVLTKAAFAMKHPETLRKIQGAPAKAPI